MYSIIPIHYVENGFCRVVYKFDRKLYCFQVENNSGTDIRFYRCSKDGESSHEVDWKGTFPLHRFEIPSGDTVTERHVRKYLEKHYENTC